MSCLQGKDSTFFSVTSIPEVKIDAVSGIELVTFALQARLQNSPYFCVFKYARAVKQKVCNEAETRALRARKTLTPRFTDFFTDFEKKTDCFAVYLQASP